VLDHRVVARLDDVEMARRFLVVNREHAAASERPEGMMPHRGHTCGSLNRWDG
jgi:hypothetical protein